MNKPPKYRQLEIASKLEILHRLEKGEGVMQLAKEYGVTHPTIVNIKRKREKLENYKDLIEDCDGALHKKKMTDAEKDPLDVAVYTWFHQKRLLGEQISGPILQAKAILLNDKLNGPKNFKASDGWLWRFKQRHGIRQLSVQGESLSSDVGAAERFRERFSALLTEYSPDNIYNADESGLQWKSLPDKTLASRSEVTAKGRKVLKDRVTIMLCANASGSHKLTPLVIGKSQKPRCFKNVSSLLVVYKNQKSSWMDRALFEEWFTECFVPEVQREQECTGIEEKVVLLVDNAPSHKLTAECIQKYPNFVVEFFPPNVTAIIQPIYQGIIEKVKRLYRKNLLTELLLGEDAQSIIQGLKGFNLKDCCHLLARAWDSVTVDNARKAWKSLNPGLAAGEHLAPQAMDVSEAVQMLHRIPGYEECDEEDTASWLNVDRDDPGWEILTDDAIVALTVKNSSEKELQVIDENEKENEECILEASKIPTATDAKAALQVLSDWLNSRDNCDRIYLQNLEQINSMISVAIDQQGD